MATERKREVGVLVSDQFVKYRDAICLPPLMELFRPFSSASDHFFFAVFKVEKKKELKAYVH